MQHEFYKGILGEIYPIAYAVAQLIEALRYKPESRGLIPEGVIAIFIDIILPVTLWPWG
jgi:hypothetical protein